MEGLAVQRRKCLLFLFLASQLASVKCDSSTTVQTTHTSTPSTMPGGDIECYCEASVAGCTANKIKCPLACKWELNSGNPMRECATPTPEHHSGCITVPTGEICFCKYEPLCNENKPAGPCIGTGCPHLSSGTGDNSNTTTPSAPGGGNETTKSSSNDTTTKSGTIETTTPGSTASSIFNMFNTVLLFAIMFSPQTLKSNH